MSTQLEDRLEKTQETVPPLPKLPRARLGGEEEQPDLWVLTAGRESSDDVPPAIAQAARALCQRDPRPVVKGPSLAADSSWLMVVDPTEETLTGSAAHRRAMMTAARNLRTMRFHRVRLGDGLSVDELKMQIEGFRVGWFEVSPKTDIEPPVLLVQNNPPVKPIDLQEAELASQATCWARYWTEQAPNVLTPAAFSAVAEQLGRSAGLEVEVYDLERLRELRMGGILAVGGASLHEPRLVVLRHRPDQTPALGIVGKGITFDSGGVSLKPSKNLRKQKGDKAGAAAVLAGALAAAQSDTDTPFMAILPLAENLLGREAYRPGDVITMMDGTTVDVISTDAEGRMILADGITLARRLSCAQIMTLATLTKACITALGYFRAAVYSEEESLLNALEQAGEQAGELLWHMPLDADYARLLFQSPVADLSHKSNYIGAGSIVAAKFLQHFTQGTPWAHIDMSSSFYLDLPMPWSPKGYLGTGGRLIYYLLKAGLID